MTSHRRAAVVIASVALGVGLAALVVSSDLAFTAPRGELLGPLMAFNPLGAIVTTVLAIVALAGAAWRSRAVVALGGAGFGAAALLQLVQAGRATNVLGGRPSTFSFFLFVGVGLVVLGGSPWRAST